MTVDCLSPHSLPWLYNNSQLVTAGKCLPREKERAFQAKGTTCRQAQRQEPSDAVEERQRIVWMGWNERPGREPVGLSASACDEQLCVGDL